ncbi:COG2426 family protein [Natranaerofaba carboxydovora]|uniref:COG2426 family protein n=1 Tax=Natranaerofaba carboxydovora TaxID=2742683 RepID=UPI001F14515B|nr:small multi-drug export protein [Natranaerofaba carboxydovora]UMZ73184.1 Putative small multi-drug export protein [Natranaerofaba carboxydovora]
MEILDMLKVIIFSALPVIEIRGGIPLGLSLGFNSWQAYSLSALGNILVIFPIFIILNWLGEFFKKVPVLNTIFNNSTERVLKRKDQYVKYGKYVLYLFVAIPLPTTGAWTASLAAYIFKIPFRDSFWIISLGVLTSGIIILIISHTTLSFF